MPQKGDTLLETGDPLTADEMDLLRNEVLGVLARDREIEDFYTGLISFKAGFYQGSLNTTSTANGQPIDTNRFKQSNQYFLQSYGVRWWFYFNPSLGLNMDFSTGTIPTVGFLREPESSTQTYVNPGLLYRGSLLVIPMIYSVTYFINSFSTTNTDDFLIGSTYSGVDLGATAYYPYRIRLFHLGWFTFSFNNLELGGAFAPAVTVSDVNYKRGTSNSGNQFAFNGGIEFNLAIKHLRFTNDLYFVIEGGEQFYNLSFSGPTTGTLPGGTPIPANGSSTETQSWFGVRLKYNIPDVIGELFNDI